MLKLNNKTKILFSFSLVLLLFCANDKNKKEQNASNDVSNLIQDTSHSEINRDSTHNENDNFKFTIDNFTATELGKTCYEGDLTKIESLINSKVSYEECLKDEIYVYDLLYTALVFNKKDIVNYVLNNKLYNSINITYTEDSETPLTMACSMSKMEDAVQVAETMIALGANVNGNGSSGGDYTKYPLIIAVKQNYSDLVKLLLKNGAKKDILNEQGETPLKIAEENNFSEIIKLLEGE